MRAIVFTQINHQMIVVGIAIRVRQAVHNLVRTVVMMINAIALGSVLATVGGAVGMHVAVMVIRTGGVPTIRHFIKLVYVVLAARRIPTAAVIPPSVATTYVKEVAPLVVS